MLNDVDFFRVCSSGSPEPELQVGIRDRFVVGRFIVCLEDS